MPSNFPTPTTFALSAGTEIVFGVLLVVAVALIRRRAGSGNAQPLPHPPTATDGLVVRAAALGALLALVGWIAGSVSEMYLVEPPAVTWWHYAAPIAGAAVGAAVLLVIATRTPTHVEAPVAPTTRRTWATFANRRELGAVTATVAALTVVSVLAGFASSSADGAWYSRLDIEGGGSTSFYGWTFGLPVLVATTVLVGLDWTALSVDARRPFRHPSAVALETAKRRASAAALVRLSFGALLLSLGGALSFIGGAGMGSSGFGIPGVGMFVWSAGYSSFAPTILWLGWGMQVVAVAVLVRIAVDGLRRRHASTTPAAGLQEDAVVA